MQPGLQPDLETSLFRRLLEAAPDAILIVSGDGRIELINEHAEKLFGYPRGELAGQPLEVLIPARYHGAHPQARSGYFTSPHRRPMGAGVDLCGLRKDGSEFPAEISLAPVQTSEGQLVTAAIRDVTERKKAEEARSRLAAIVDSSDDAIVGKSLEGLITSWNHGAERLFGYRADEMLGKPISLLFGPGLEGDEPQLFARVRRGERIAPFEVVRRCKDGRDIHVSVTISPVHDARGVLIGASNVARDISERKRTEEALARAVVKAEVAVRELESFSYSVAHDLRAPLRGLDGFSQMLEADYGDRLDAKGQRYLSLVRDSARHMGELLDSLLALACVTRVEIQNERVDLTELARAVTQRLRTHEPERAVTVLIEDGLAGRGDRALVAAALENLLGNAWKFTRKAPNPCIEFGQRGDAASPTYFVRDNGAGFDTSSARTLFGPFQRFHAVGEFEGTGIGLATVQRIISRHGGRVWAEAEVGHGATFFFTLTAPRLDRQP